MDASADSAEAGRDAATYYAKVASGWFLFFGLLGLLFVGFTGEARELFWMTVDPVSSVMHLAIGLVGSAMVTTPARARRFTLALTPLLVAWALIGLLADGALGAWSTGDTETVVMHLAFGIAGGVAAAWPMLARVVST